MMDTPHSYAAFEGPHRIAEGSLLNVALEVKARGDAAMDGSILIFDSGGHAIDLDLRGSAADIENRLHPATEAPQQRGPGRPKLGVVAREVTLLPRHWDWLNTQSGGASVALRKLVEAARHASESGDRARHAKDSAYRFMSAIAGNQAGFEEAIRALFAGQHAGFDEHTKTWPADIRDHARMMAAPAFA